MKFWILLLALISIPALAVERAQKPDEADPDDEGYTYEVAQGLDLDHSWVDPYELVKVLSYDSKTNTYEVSKLEDPTIARIFTTPEYLAHAVPSLNLDILKTKPASIVGQKYDTSYELVLIEQNEMDKRAQVQAAPATANEKVAVER